MFLLTALNRWLFWLRPNGPELSCGNEPRRRGGHSARGMSSPIVTGCFARAKSSTAGSVSLSDWLGGKVSWLSCTKLRTKNASFLILVIDIAPNYDCLVSFPCGMIPISCSDCN